MSQSEGPNPERRTTNAILCFCIGAGLVTGAWILGFGAVLGAALSGGNPAVVVGGAIAAISLVLAAIVGGVLMLIGVVWMFVQVIADQRGEASEKRYRNIER
jgi:hypothetical protein